MMSIATIGPEKYDFQDLVCIKLALDFYQNENAQLIIEGNGGEDAEIVLDSNDKMIVYEIQVKGSEEHFGFPLIAECLGHFPAGQSTHFFLERLLKDINRFAVMVMSGRANDPLQKFIPRGNWQGEEHGRVYFTHQDAQQLIDALLSYADTFKGSPIQLKRKTYLFSYIQGIDKKLLVEAFKRLIIIDNVHQTALTEHCRQILRKDFSVPDDAFDSQINGLKSVIKSGRASKQNIMPEFLTKLHEDPIQTVKPKSYTLRGDENDFLNTIENRHVLLLSGKPRVGKSNTARWVAATYQSRGYRILRTQDVETAERFLLDYVRSHRLVLIDDPFGGAHATNKPHEKWVLLKRIIDNAGSGRKVIVAQGQERLFELAGVHKLTALHLNGHHWNDLSDTPDAFLLKCWVQYESQIPENIYQTIATYIQHGRLNIEPGCLSYLAMNHSGLESLDSPEKIIRFSRKEAGDLGIGLMNEGFRDLMLGLAVSTSHLESISDCELAWVLHIDDKGSYGISKKTYGYSYGIPQEEDILEFPEYSPEPILTTDEEGKLDSLEKRLIVQTDDSEKTNFTHPFYRSAAESLFGSSGRREFKKIEQALRKGIFCLSPSTARASASNIFWVYDQASAGSNKNMIIQLAIDGLDSSYPSVRDICFDFLIQQVPTLSLERQNQVPSWTYKVNNSSYSALQWNNGQPWYPMNDEDTIGSTWFHEYDENYIEKLLDDMSSGVDVTLTSKDSYDIVHHLQSSHERLDKRLMTKLLSVNEGFIRALAAKLWMRINRENDTDILERIFRETHPAVAESVFQSAVRGWSLYSPERQQFVLNALSRIASQPVLANAIMQLLVIFEREHATGDSPPWQVFSRLFPIALSSLPSTALVSFPRLANVVDEAQQRLKPVEMIDVLTSWVTFLEKQTSYLDSFALNATPALLRIDLPEFLLPHRFSLILRLLALRSTSNRMRVIQDLVHSWTQLTLDERSVVCAQLNDKSPDSRWLWAAVLILPVPPSDLVKCIMPDHNSLTVESLASLEPTLFEAIVMVATECAPSPSHHINAELRKALVEMLSKDILNPLAPLAIDFIISFFFADKEKLFCELINDADEIQLKKIFECLFYSYLNSNPEYMPMVWKKLFNRASSAMMIEQWLSKFIKHANDIFTSLHPDDVRQFIPDDYINIFFKELPDIFYYAYTSNFTKSELCKSDGVSILVSEDMKSIFIENIHKRMVDSPPVHHGTYLHIIKTLNKMHAQEMEIQFFSDARGELFKGGCYDRPYSIPKVTDWQD
ncbi:TPA: hypothetical protein ACXK2U_000390 [Serratia marcescens]